MNNNSSYSTPIRLLLALSLTLSILGCSDSKENTQKQPPIIFESGDECHLCGMLIVQFPGPKAQAFESRSPRIRKFCSTTDMFSWYLQPENKPNINEIYVHDMAQNNWEKPDDARLIDARTAFYVIDSSRKGSMGKTISSFAKMLDATNFSNQWGGQVITFEQITFNNITP